MKDKVEGAGNLLVYGLAGIVQLAKMAYYEKCEIYVANNHFHNVFVAIDDSKKQKMKGWYIVNAYSTEKIYKTERATHEVGMHAFCPICGRNWGNNYLGYVPAYYGKNFEIKYANNNEFQSFKYDRDKRPAYFTTSPSLATREECTFTLN